MSNAVMYEISGDGLCRLSPLMPFIEYNSVKYDDANARKTAFCISLMSDIFRYEVSANARAYSLIIAPHALRRSRLKIRFGLLTAVPKKATSRQNEAGGTLLLTT